MKKLYKEFRERRFIDFSIDLVEDTISAIFKKGFIVTYIIFTCYAVYSFFNSYMNLDINGCYQIRNGDTIKVMYKAENIMNIAGMTINDYVFVIEKQSIHNRSCLGSVSEDVYNKYKIGDTTELPLR